jgi:glyoxylase I family protein
MTIEHVLAVVPVTDIDNAASWYEKLLGIAPNNRPMDSLVEWRITETGWLQVTSGTNGAGATFVNLAVDDLAEHLAALRDRGLEPGVIQNVNKGVQLSTINDPDGNTITFIGNFRAHY